MTRALVVVSALAALSATAALGAGPGPDSHDRVLASRLDASKRTFDKLAAQKQGGFDSIDKSLVRCLRVKVALRKAALTAASASAFARQFYPLEAAAAAQAVDVFGPVYRGFSQTMLAMHPHRCSSRRAGVRSPSARRSAGSSRSRPRPPT